MSRKLKSLNSIGTVYHDSLKDYPQSITYFQQSFKVAQEINNRPTQLDAVRNLGLANYKLQNYQKAIDYYQQALAIAQEIKNKKTRNKNINKSR